MTVRVDERVARCLTLLRSPEFRPLLEFLEGQHAETLKRLCESQQTEQTIRLQGRALQAKEFLDLVDSGSTLLAKTSKF